MSDVGEVMVWRAGRNLRLISYAVLALVVVLSVRVLVTYGYLATIGVVLVLAAASQLWWTILRPRLVAGPRGVDVIAGRTPVHLEWQEIRRVEAGGDGLRIFCANGREVRSRFPQKPRLATDSETEADLVAAFLAQRAAWERRPTGGQPPRYCPPAP